MNRFGLIVVLILVGCGGAMPTPTAIPTVIEALPQSTEVLPELSPRPGINYPPDPQSVVQSFLAALQLESDEVDPSIYLAEDFQAQLANDRTLPELLGSQEPFEWFEVKSPQRLDASTATVKTILHYSQNDEERHFTLSEDAPGLWRISSILP